MKQYGRVRVLNNNYITKGVKIGDIGFVIELWDATHVEVEFCNECGIDYAMLPMSIQDLEEIEG